MDELVAVVTRAMIVGVNARFVDSQCGAASEGLVALITIKGLLAGVRECVCEKPLRSVVCLATYHAFEAL